MQPRMRGETLLDTSPQVKSAGKPVLLASIVDSSEDAIISTTLAGIVTSWNKAAERIYGYQANEIIGKKVSRLLDPERVDEMGGVRDRIRNGENVPHYETTRRRKDGSTISVSVTVSPIRDAKGNVVGTSSTARDITEQERVLDQAIVERERVQDQALIASQYARSLIEASRDPFVMISPEGKVTDVNEATIRVTGISREGLVGTDFFDYFTEPDKAREGYQEVFAKGFVTDYPLTIHHTDGRLTEVLYNASAYKDVDGHVLSVFAAARDVTAQNRAEAALADTRAKEMDRLLELERFQRLTVGRELKMIELKKEIEELKSRLPASDAS
jgi:PAS domain S-box-containing protein